MPLLYLSQIVLTIIWELVGRERVFRRERALGCTSNLGAGAIRTDRSGLKLATDEQPAVTVAAVIRIKVTQVRPLGTKILKL